MLVVGVVVVGVLVVGTGEDVGVELVGAIIVPEALPSTA